MRIVAFFNHKGGVGKTTIVFNVALALGEAGHRVTIVDADAQANASGLALGEKKYEQAVNERRTIWSAVSPLVTGAGDFQQLEPIKIRDNVWILPGDIRLSNFEAICPQGWTESLASQARGFRVTAALYRLCQSFDQLVESDYVLMDLGPNVNALNRTALIGSDGFVVPLAPDLFSIMALPSVGQSIKDWSAQWQTALDNRPPALDFALPAGNPVPIGYVSQQFSVYRSRASAAYQQWLDRIPDAYHQGVVEPLAEASERSPESEEIGSLPNFHSLVPLAQDASKGIFELTGSEARGAHYTKAMETRGVFSGIATKIAERMT